ncbi:MAG: class I SAM-dependent methyltransferase [Alphaproteobacteria bacterium]
MDDAARANWTLKEDIREYWSRRAETFDDSPGHRIDDRFEAPYWHALLDAAFGDLAGRRVLDVACGTGEISRMLLARGAAVTGVDFAEPMLDRARAKHRGKDWRGRLADAETLAGEPDDSYDAVVTRHLVWTLLDPPAAFAAWHRVLKPGGRLLVVDGNWVRPTPVGRLLRALANRLGAKRSGDGDPERHAAILAQVHYRDGLTAARLADDLGRAGFTGFRRHGMGGIYGPGLRGAPLTDRLRLRAASRFAVSACKRGTAAG